ESCLLYHAAWHGRLATEWVRACLLLHHGVRLVLWAAVAACGRRHRLGLYWASLRRLVRPSYIGELCQRPRKVPQLPATGAGSGKPPLN
ncbi:MAG: hypothetical protein ABIP94_07565, partial [Planctomycetota bacterium]